MAVNPFQAGTPKLIRRARREGVKAAKSGKFDEWSLIDENATLYQRQLAAERAAALTRLEATSAVRRARLRASTRGTAVPSAVLEEEIGSANKKIAAYETFMDTSVTQMDHQALHEAVIRETLDKKKGNTDAPPADMPSDAESAAPATEIHPTMGGSATRGLPRRKWEGPYGNRLPPWLMYGLIGLIIAIEVPVQLQIFRHFDDDARLTVPFAASVAVVMGILPHLAGRFFRERRRTGAERTAGWIALAALLPWAALAGFFGSLRSSVLFQDTEQPADAQPGDPALEGFNADGWSLPDATGSSVPTLIERLHLNSLTVTIMFAVLLLLAGLVGFLLGMAEDHPMVGAYLGAAAEREKTEKAIRARRQGAEAAQQRLDELNEREKRREREIMALYQAAEAAYLDAITSAMRKPSVTEAVSSSAARATR